MSRTSPDAFFEDDSLHRMVKVCCWARFDSCIAVNATLQILLNEQDEAKSDYQTKLDVLNILGNLAMHEEHRADIKGQPLGWISRARLWMD
jgi:hypothetical protein